MRWQEQPRPFGVMWARVAQFETELDGQKIAQNRATATTYPDLET
jgi:hypothetical protein